MNMSCENESINAFKEYNPFKEPYSNSNVKIKLKDVYGCLYLVEDILTYHSDILKKMLDEKQVSKGMKELDFSLYDCYCLVSFFSLMDPHKYRTFGEVFKIKGIKDF